MLLRPHDALQRILETCPQLTAEAVPLERAGGEVLREPIVAERDQPPFDRVTMDGIALCYASYASGITRFRSLGTQAAGATPMQVIDPGTCVEVMTGTPLPYGADCVVPIERLAREESADGSVHLQLADDADPVQHTFIHPQGSDYLRASTLLTPGTYLGPPELAVLASSGRATVQVSRRPRIAVLPTGSELITPGAPIEDHQIRRSNDFAISAALRARGHQHLAVEALMDDPVLLERAIARHLERQDALVLTGGVSMGKFDHLPTILNKLGVERVFHRIQQRPGRPMWFGVHPARSVCVFALPGNPVSSLVCLARYVLPALDHAMGLPTPAPQWVQMAETVTFKPALYYHLPVRLAHREEDGVALALPNPTNTSGDFAALAGSPGFVQLPADESSFPAGYVARLWRW
ncbi:MAG: molybdopterin molybdotransferase MoeA [Pseudomonadota bacterium]